MSSLVKLKTLNLDRLDADEAVELVTAGRAMVATYGTYQVAAPGWLTDAIATLDNEIKRRHRDMLEARRKDLKAQQAALLSREEKRESIAAELAKLDQQLS